MKTLDLKSVNLHGSLPRGSSIMIGESNLDAADIRVRPPPAIGDGLARQTLQELSPGRGSLVQTPVQQQLSIQPASLRGITKLDHFNSRQSVNNVTREATAR